MSDQELVNLLKQGSEEAFRSIYERYWGILYGRAYRKLGHLEEINDILQEIFLHCWKHRATLAIETNFTNYFLTALDYKIIDFYRSMEVRRNFYHQHLLNTDSGHTVVMDTVNYRDLERVIRQEIALMPKRMQQIFLLSRDERLQSAAIAKQLSLSDQSVRNQISAAIHRLRSRVGDLLSI
ncbi:RNA polymerase sigma factor [Chitinophaga sp.]|uniref:RNA polymerase sigma factor n=1 Tax=Chitinophaga sp. TaxID=1869181 RepID=UPI002F933808